MPTSLTLIAGSLKAAREAKGLTQSALGERVGLPQSHISKIESGQVDLQTSSLLELARALDLELTLVPREMIPAVQALQRGGAHGERPMRRRAYTLDDEPDADG